MRNSLGCQGGRDARTLAGVAEADQMTIFAPDEPPCVGRKEPLRSEIPPWTKEYIADSFTGAQGTAEIRRRPRMADDIRLHDRHSF
jgi:hypothetical protein